MNYDFVEINSVEGTHGFPVKDISEYNYCDNKLNITVNGTKHTLTFTFKHELDNALSELRVAIGCFKTAERNRGVDWTSYYNAVDF